MLRRLALFVVLVVLLVLAHLTAPSASGCPDCKQMTDFAIGGKLNVEPYKLVRLKAEFVPEDAAVLWSIRSDKKWDSSENGAELVFTGPPGTYTVEALAIKLEGKKTVVVRKTVEVTIGTPPAPVDKPAPKGVEAALGKLLMRGGMCSATVIGPRRKDGTWLVFTAAHCTRNDKAPTLELESVGRIPLKMLVRDPKSDVCWCVTAKAFDHLPHTLLAKKVPAVGTAIWHKGYGRDKPGNIETGRVTSGVQPDGRFYSTLSVSPGDSGSGWIDKATGECVGTLFGVTDRKATAGSCDAAWKLRPGEG